MSLKTSTSVGILPTLLNFNKTPFLMFKIVSDKNEIGFKHWNGRYEASALSPLLGGKFEALAIKYLKDIYTVVDDGILYVFGDTYQIKDKLKSVGFKWGGYDPTPHWKGDLRELVTSQDLPQEINKLIVEKMTETFEEVSIYEPEGWTLYEHQKQGVQEIHDHSSYLHSWEMGSGKTIPPLSYAKEYNLELFAVVPASIRTNWYREAKNFDMKPAFFPKLPTMKAKFKKFFSQFTLEESNVAITSYATMNKTFSHRPVKGGKKIMDINQIIRIAKKYDLFVFDESQYIKNYKAQRTKIVLELIKQAKKFGKKVLFLSGTPLLNRPAELFTTLKVLIPSLEGFRKFTERYNGGYDNGFGWFEGNTPAHLPELHKRMCRVSSRILKEDCLDLPSKTRQDFMIGSVKINRIPKPEDPNKLLGWMQKYKQAIAIGKIKHTSEIAQSNYPCLVFTGFIDVNNQICATLRAEGLRVAQIYSGVDAGSKDEIVQKYQNGELDVVVCGIRAAGVGITLTKGSNVIFNDMDWSPGAMLQAEDRAHRVGQKNAVTITIMVCDDDFDQMLFNQLSEKFNVIKSVLDGEEIDFSGSVMQEMRQHFLEKFKFMNGEN